MAAAKRHLNDGYAEIPSAIVNLPFMEPACCYLHVMRLYKGEELYLHFRG